MQSRIVYQKKATMKVLILMSLYTLSTARVLFSDSDENSSGSTEVGTDRGYKADTRSSLFPELRNFLDSYFDRRNFYNKRETTFNVNVCHGEDRDISCPEGKFVSVIFANFGRLQDNTVCGAHITDHDYCFNPVAYQITHSQCFMKKSCTLQASTGKYGRSCSGGSYYLNVKYQCHNS